MKKILLFFLLTTTICNAQFWKKKIKKDDYQPKKEQIQELKYLFSPNDSINSIQLRDKLVKELQNNFTYKDHLINRTNGKISEIAYFYKNQKGDNLIIGFKKENKYILKSIQSSFKVLQSIWSDKFRPGVPAKELKENYKYTILESKENDITITIRKGKDIWEIKNLN